MAHIFVKPGIVFFLPTEVPGSTCANQPILSITCRLAVVLMSQRPFTVPTPTSVFRLASLPVPCLQATLHHLLLGSLSRSKMQLKSPPHSSAFSHVLALVGGGMPKGVSYGYPPASGSWWEMFAEGRRLRPWFERSGTKGVGLKSVFFLVTAIACLVFGGDGGQAISVASS